MNLKKNAPKKAYQPPTITRVKLEDKEVVAMAVCKADPEILPCGEDGTPRFTINPS
jgi:hypothetical protein